MPTIQTLVRRIFAVGAGACLAAVFLIIFVNSIGRYAFGQSVRWSEELPIYLTVYGTMFGVALAYMQDRHIRFTILTDALSEGLKNRLFAAMDLVTAITGVFLAWSGVLFVMRGGGVTSSGLSSTARYFVDATGLDWLIWLGRVGTWQSAIAVGGALLALAALLRFIDRLTSGEEAA